MLLYVSISSVLNSKSYLHGIYDDDDDWHKGVINLRIAK